MVNTSDKVEFDLGAEFGDNNYKSYFARSMVVNSQYKHSKTETTQSLDLNHLVLQNNCSGNIFCNTNGSVQISKGAKMVSGENHSSLQRNDLFDAFRLKQECQNLVEEHRRRSISSVTSISTSGSSAGSRGSCVTRASDMPVENFVLKSQLDTVQWQLKQSESSRDMYRAVMKQMVSFLERAHRSLELLGERLSQPQRTVPRSKSEHHVASGLDDSECQSRSGTLTRTMSSASPQDDYAAFRDFTWRRAKKQDTSPEEIPPEKLSQEAFRLLRTAQSLLNTREPNLAPCNYGHETNGGVSTPNDQDFLSQLAKEFPLSRPLPQRTSSFSVNQQIPNSSDRDVRISTAFNRKLSLQRHPPIAYSRRSSISTRDSFRMNQSLNGGDSARGSVAESDYCLMSSTLLESEVKDFNGLDKRRSRSSISSSRSTLTQNSVLKPEDKMVFDTNLRQDKAGSPPMGSVSSAEDESGFSSMNSFQEVGLPLVNSTILDKINGNNKETPKKLSQMKSKYFDALFETNEDEKKLWHTSEPILPVHHNRWNSTPVESVVSKDPINVLWV